MKRIIVAICFVFSISLTIKAYDDYYDYYYTGLDFSDSDVRYQDIDIKVSTPSSAKGLVYMLPYHEEDTTLLLSRTKTPSTQAYIKGPIGSDYGIYKVQIACLPKKGYVVDGVYQNNKKIKGLRNGVFSTLSLSNISDTIGDPKTNPRKNSNYKFSPQFSADDVTILFRPAISKTINIAKKGTLKAKLLTIPNYEGIEDLTITGTLNALDFAFLKELANKNLAYLDISNTNVKIIPAECFKGTNLYYIKLPKNLTKIGERAFYDCNKLKPFKIPSSVVDLGIDYYKLSSWWLNY